MNFKPQASTLQIVIMAIVFVVAFSSLCYLMWKAPEDFLRKKQREDK